MTIDLALNREKLRHTSNALAVDFNLRNEGLKDREARTNLERTI